MEYSSKRYIVITPTKPKTPKTANSINKEQFQLELAFQTDTLNELNHWLILLIGKERHQLIISLKTFLINVYLVNTYDKCPGIFKLPAFVELILLQYHWRISFRINFCTLNSNSPLIMLIPC